MDNGERDDSSRKGKQITTPLGMGKEQDLTSNQYGILPPVITETNIQSPLCIGRF